MKFFSIFVDVYARLLGLVLGGSLIVCAARYWHSADVNILVGWLWAALIVLILLAPLLALIIAWRAIIGMNYSQSTSEQDANL